MEKGVGQFGSQAAVLEDVVAVEEPAFDRKALREADEVIARYVQSATTGSATIQDVIEEINKAAIEALAKERFSNPLLRSGYKTYLTLAGKDAVSIINEQGKSIEDVVRAHEGFLRGIDRDLKVNSKKYENLLSGLRKVKNDVDTFEYGVNGYGVQIEEIEQLIAARREGKDPADVQLTALDPECYNKDVSELERMRGAIETKHRTATLELSKLYATGNNITTKLKQTARTVNVLKAQYNTGLEDMGKQLDQQGWIYQSDFIKIIQTQLESAKLQEKAEKKINGRVRVVEPVIALLENSMDLILNPYRASYYASEEGKRSGEAIDKAMDSMAERGEVGMETLRTNAYAGFNEFLA